MHVVDFFYNHMYFRVRTNMIGVTAQYFSLNRLLLLVIGLWPYQQSKLDRLRFIFILSILISAILFQVRQYLDIIMSYKDMIMGLIF